MIDFHTHILPDLDDGACFWSDAFNMAQNTLNEGITAVVLTPHYIERQYQNTRKRILFKTKELKHKLAQAGITLEVYPGVEARLEPELPKRLSDNLIIKEIILDNPGAVIQGKPLT
jgi:protein-tyrosine phosphatase